MAEQTPGLHTAAEEVQVWMRRKKIDLLPEACEETPIGIEGGCGVMFSLAVPDARSSRQEPTVAPLRCACVALISSLEILFERHFVAVGDTHEASLVDHDGTPEC